MAFGRVTDMNEFPISSPSRKSLDISPKRKTLTPVFSIKSLANANKKSSKSKKKTVLSKKSKPSMKNRAFIDEPITFRNDAV